MFSRAMKTKKKKPKKTTKKEQNFRSFKKLLRKLDNEPDSLNEQWDLWCKKNKNVRDREEVIIGAVLTQQTNWRNVEIAMDNLRRLGLASLKAISLSDEKNIADAIKPAGYYRSKSRCLINLAKCVLDKHGSVTNMMNGELVILRQSLLGVKGVGFETADSILLYALDKRTFVVDEYTRRLAVKLWPEDAFPKKEKPVQMNKNVYLFLKNVFEEHLEEDFSLFQDVHAKIVIYGKKEGAKKRPAKGISKGKR
jgi:endonuclease-3 related protein